MNASFGKFVRSRAVGLLLRLMREKRDAIVIAAAGNEDTLTMEYPAAFSDAIAVAAVDSATPQRSFSNFGRWVDISAPGALLISAIPGGSSAPSPARRWPRPSSPARRSDAGALSDDEFRRAAALFLDGADPHFYERDFEDGFNFYNYYPQIPQEEVRQPLLGLGVINAEASINKTPTVGLPVFSALDRVKPGCSPVGGATDASGALALLLAALALPFLARRSGCFASLSMTRTATLKARGYAE